MDWTKHYKDPTNTELQKKMKDYLSSIRKIGNRPSDKWLLNQVNDRSCLDIGGAGHNRDDIGSSDWKHGKIAKKAKSTLGIDIERDLVRKIQRKGYEFKLCDATSDTYLGQTFDIVVGIDVIEHVSRPVELIKFAIRHLEQDGKAIFTTPNPYYIDNIKRFIKNTYKALPNFQHVAWYTPTMALELARRADCKLESYVVFLRKRPICKLFPKSDIWTRDYTYIFSKPNGQK